MKKIDRRKFIRNTSLLGVSSLILGAAPLNKIIYQSNSFDLLIKNGNIIDGNGKKEFKADIGIKNGKIIAIENLQNASANKIIDAKCLKVVPGFIDIHSHTDSDLIINPKAESKIRQGVTTEICGQDGSSWGPVGGPNLDEQLENFKENYGEELAWRTLGEFLDNFSNRKFCVNLASMIGLGTVRKVVVGLDDRPATSEEIKQMQKIVEKAIEDGAVGVSTGLEYTPGSFASTEELIEMCKAAPEHARVYATHMRNEADNVLKSIDESIKVAQGSSSSLEISHLKMQGKPNWHKVDEALEKIDKVYNEGLNINADRYTYLAFHTDLANLFPLWSRDGGTKKFIERLNDVSLLTKMRTYAENKVSSFNEDWNGVLISGIGNDSLRIFQGKTIKQIAEERNEDYFNTTVDLIKKTDNNVSMVGFAMNEKSTEKILAHPLVMISSDAGAHAPYPPMNKTIAHPRAYGTFPRAIAKYVKERKICSLEEMIKKMTSMPADKIKLKNKGRIEKNKDADIVIFSYEKIKDKATFLDPHQYPQGIPYVIVNGEIVINEGEHTGAMPGKVLKS